MSGWRKIGLPLFLAAAAAPAHAQADDSAVARFNECAAIRNDTARLSCFDRVTRDVRAHAPAPTTMAGRRPVNREELARSQRENFGLTVQQQEERRPRGSSGKLKNMVAKVAASKRYEPGYWAILLDDGAIWEVTELDPNFEGPRRGETVKIRRGMMGGFLLDVGHQASVRVRRVS